MQLTLAEFNEAYWGVLKAFTEYQKKAWDNRVYRVNNNYSKLKAKQLFLFAFALDTWDNSIGAYNYLTESQMLSIINKAK